MSTEMKPVYRTITEIDVKSSGRNFVHIRYAIVNKGNQYVLPAGKLVVYLGEEKGQYIYRSAEGQILISSNLLIPGEQVEQVDDIEVITAMNSFFTHEDYLAKRGLKFDTPTYDHSPFSMIKCPMCGGTNFYTMEHGEVSCDCGTFFKIRFTGGDPGAVIDATIEEYNWRQAKFIIPANNKFHFSATVKLSLASMFPSRVEGNNNNTTDGQSSTIRAGVNKDLIYEVYKWSFWGDVPEFRDISHAVRNNFSENRDWLRSSTVDVLPNRSKWVNDKHLLKRLLHLTEKNTPDDSYTIEYLQKLIDLPSKTPYINVPRHRELPDMKILKEGEYYLLHHWALYKDQYSDLSACPVWYIVKPRLVECVTEFDVIEDAICPICGEIVTQENMKAFGEVKDYENYWNETEDPHGGCFVFWNLTGWCLPEKQNQNVEAKNE